MKIYVGENEREREETEQNKRTDDSINPTVLFMNYPFNCFSTNPLIS